MPCQIIPMSEANPKAVLNAYILAGYPEEKRPAVLMLTRAGNEREAELAAAQLNAEGSHAFVLFHSAYGDEKLSEPILEGCNAVLTICDRAGQWCVDAGRISVRIFPDGDSAAHEDDKPKQYYANIYEDRAGMFRHSPFSSEQLLVRHVMKGDEKAALEALGNINRHSAKAVLAKEPLRSVKNSIICSCTILTRAAIQAGVPDQEAFALSDAEILHIESLRSMSEVLAYEESMLLQVIKLVNRHKGKGYSMPVRRALHFIDAHLEQSFVLADVAEYTGMHPNYLSKLFKQETGTTLTSYANARKIREAAYFVQHTDYPMAEIAALYGFSSQSYFISSFKKVMGASPGEYRRRESG